MDILEEINKLNNIKVSWRDYCLFLLNSSNKNLRENWREKLITSIIHASFNYGILSENNLAGLEILTILPNDFTLKIVDDCFEENSWDKADRIAGSKKMKVKLGHYPQESICNEANLCLKYIVDNWDEYNYLIFETPLLKRIWDFSQKSKGNCLYPDEVLTYNLERFLDKNSYGNWIDACEDIYLNGIPSNKFRKYYFCDKYLNWDKENDKLKDYPFNSNNFSLEEKQQNFLNVCDIILKEDITGCPNWKRICICILKNDISFNYAGFAKTQKERLAREEAIAAFEKIKSKYKN